MSRVATGDDKLARVERVRAIVREDYERVRHAASPREALNASSHEDVEAVETRFKRYERFYRAENFQRLGDIDLTRKALEIRRLLGRAMAELRQQGAAPRQSEKAVTRHDTGLFASESDRAALGHIYLRDGMTYLRLGDVREACSLLREAVDYAPQSGLAHAYLAYTNHKCRPFDAAAVRDSRDHFEIALEIAPEETDVLVLQGRFFAKLGESNNLQRVIVSIETIDPAHPMLDRLQRKLHQLRG